MYFFLSLSLEIERNSFCIFHVSMNFLYDIPTFELYELAMHSFRMNILFVKIHSRYTRRNCYRILTNVVRV